MKDFQELINFAKIAQQTQRYDDMCKFTKQAIKISIQIKNQQRTLLANAYKCKINSRRTAWRALSTLQCKQSNSKSRTGTIIQYYKQSIQKQIREIANDILSIVGPFLNSDKIDNKAKIQFYKIKGDYYRYLCQIAQEQELKKFQKECELAYIKALQLVQEPNLKEVMKTNPIKLGISLNFSVFIIKS